MDCLTSGAARAILFTKAQHFPEVILDGPSLRWWRSFLPAYCSLSFAPVAWDPPPEPEGLEEWVMWQLKAWDDIHLQPRSPS